MELSRENSLSFGSTEQRRFKRKFAPGSCRVHVAVAKNEGLMLRSDQSKWFSVPRSSENLEQANVEC
jgi:hypothetical protein